MTNPKRAYYSPTAAEKYGSFIYRNAEGSEVEITGVEPGLEDTGTYKWVDAVVVGPVLNYMRQGKPGQRTLSWPLSQFPFQFPVRQES